MLLLSLAGHTNTSVKHFFRDVLVWPARLPPAQVLKCSAVELAMSIGHDDTSDELVANWSTELEAVLYSPEVHEAIKEVRNSILLTSRDMASVLYSINLKCVCYSERYLYLMTGPVKNDYFLETMYEKI